MPARKPADPATQQWDDFWTEVNAKSATETIRGVVVRVPTDMPLGFQQRANELKDSTRDEDIRELTAMIFGEGVLDQWIAAGMGAREFMVVCGWGFRNGSGQPTTFREAFDLMAEAEAEGKAASAPSPNRATRRAATKKPSSAGGATSKRTSPASTASARKTSRT